MTTIYIEAHEILDMICHGSTRLFAVVYVTRATRGERMIRARCTCEQAVSEVQKRRVGKPEDRLADDARGWYEIRETSA